MLVLGIETSCDETAAAVVNNEKQILSNIVFSQTMYHQQYNGVVPEIATRAHIQNIDKTIDQAMSQAKCHYNDIDAIAVTAGPGLAGCLIVGLMTAKGIAAASNKPLIAINHLEGHLLTTRLTHTIQFPYLALLASGGHCQIIIAEGLGKYKKIGETLDDSAGEAFDKVAKMLNLKYPGGPEVEKCAKNGTPNLITLPRPMSLQNNLNLSFSGLKTAVKNKINKINNITQEEINNVCASFQEAVKDIFITKLTKAIPLFKKQHPESKNIIFAGGVAANKYIRKHIEILAQNNNMSLTVPPISLCTDNAAMIAWAGIERAQKKLFCDINIKHQPRWSLYELRN